MSIWTHSLAKQQTVVGEKASMRILYVTPYVPSRIRVRPYNLIKRLVQSNDITLIPLVMSEHDREALSEMRSICREVIPISQPKCQSLISCVRKTFTKMPLQAAYTWQPEVIRALYEAVARDRYDVLHVEHIRSAHFASDIASLPKVYDSVDCITLLLRQSLQSKKNPLSWFLAFEEWAKMRVYEGMIPQFFDKVIITSPGDKEALDTLIWQRIRKQFPNGPVSYKDISLKHREEWRLTRQLIETAQDRRLAALMSGRQQVSVLPNGVDFDYFHPIDVPEEPGTVVFSGKMSYFANEAAVNRFYHNIFPIIRAKRPETRLVIVGADPPSGIRRLSGDPHVKVTGYVDDIRPYLAKATVAICPISVGVGIQNKVLEAMAIGKPVVATGKACGAIEARDGVELIKADSDEKFADAVVELLERPDLRKKIGRRAAEFVKDKHDWDAMAHKLEEIYLEAREIFVERVHAA